MARGLDIESVSHVISLGLPSSLNYYTHKVEEPEEQEEVEQVMFYLTRVIITELKY